MQQITKFKKRNNLKLILSIIFVAVIFTFISIKFIQSNLGGWIIDNSTNSVYVDDNNVFISANPYTLYGSSWVTFNVTSKNYTGSVDALLGFDINQLQPTAIQLYSPHNDSYNYTCQGNFFNYTTNPNFAWCYINSTTNSSSVLLFSHSFDYGNLSTSTIYWNETNPWNTFPKIYNSTNYNYDGMNKWWYITGVNINANQNYVFRVYMNSSFSNPWTNYQEKYTFAIKPTGENISQAIANSHLYLLDPWWGSLTNGLIHSYNFSDNGGTVAKDLRGGEIGQQLNGTYSGNVEANMSGAIFRGGLPGSVNISNYVGVPNGTQSFTVAMIVNITVGQSPLGVVDLFENSIPTYTANGTWDISTNLASTTQGYSGAASIGSVLPNVTMANSSLHSIIFMGNSTHMTIYVNGSTGYTAARTGIINMSTPANKLIFGCRWLGTNCINGNSSIIFIGIWNRSISPEEVSNVVNGGTFLRYTGQETAKPNITIIYPSSNNTGFTNMNLNINYTATDDVGLNVSQGASCWYSNDTFTKNITLTNCGTNITTITWSNASHSIRIYVNDTSNNVNWTTLTFITNTLVPNITIMSPANNSYTANFTTAINFIELDDMGHSSCWYSNDTFTVNSTPDTTCGNITSVTWLNGTHAVRVYVNDTVNNQNVSTVTFTVSTWANTTFTSCKNISIANAGTTNLTNFPVFINVSYVSTMNPDYSDVRFYDMPCNYSGDALYYELANYTSKAGVFWVGVNVSTGGLNISMYYDNATAVSSLQDPKTVWSRAGYQNVYHFSGGINFNDSLGLANGTMQNSTSTTVATSPIDGATFFYGRNQSVLLTNQSSLNNTNQFSIEAIVNPANLSSSNKTIYEEAINSSSNARIKFGIGANNRFQLQVRVFNDSAGLINTVNSTVAISVGTWYYVGVVFNATGIGIGTQNMLVNGINNQSVISINRTGMGAGFVRPEIASNTTGGENFNGTITELRISRSNFSIDWLNESYQTALNQVTYVTFGAEKTFSSQSYLRSINQTIFGYNIANRVESDFAKITQTFSNFNIVSRFYTKVRGIVQLIFEFNVVSRVENDLAKISQFFTNFNSVSRFITRVRGITQTFFNFNSISRLSNGFRTISQFFTNFNSVSRSQVLKKTLSQFFTNFNSVSRFITRVRGITQTFFNFNSISRFYNFQKVTSQSFTNFNSISRLENSLRAVFQNIFNFNKVSRTPSLSRSISNFFTNFNKVSRLGNFARTPSQNIFEQNTLGTIKGFLRGISDFFNTRSFISPIKGFLRNPSQDIYNSNSISRFYTFPRNMFQSFNLFHNFVLGISKFVLCPGGVCPPAPSGGTTGGTGGAGGGITTIPIYQLQLIAHYYKNNIEVYPMSALSIGTINYDSVSFDVYMNNNGKYTIDNLGLVDASPDEFRTALPDTLGGALKSGEAKILWSSDPIPADMKNSLFYLKVSGNEQPSNNVVYAEGEMNFVKAEITSAYPLSSKVHYYLNLTVLIILIILLIIVAMVRREKDDKDKNL